MGKITLDRLLYTHYQHVNLKNANKFFEDFGLIPVQNEDSLIYYRGFGDSPFIYIAEKSPDAKRHFIGGGWVVSSRDDLDTASKLPGASPIGPCTTPGGGKFVDLTDPNGVNIRLIHGITYRREDEQEQDKPKPVVFNSWNEKPRKGEFQRFKSGPSKVHKLGHYGLVVDQRKFDGSVSWYLDTFNLLETDSLYDRQSGKNMMTFMHIDKGDEFTDHHVSLLPVADATPIRSFYAKVLITFCHIQSFFIHSPPNEVSNCTPHHSSFEVDNLDTQLLGHYHLEAEGWTNSWGVGRHLLGSQIFDYW
jgi:hypothetical protein